MSTCNTCGREIEFRYINGRCIPMHIDGGCDAYCGSILNINIVRPFKTIDSYVNPNARCPVCNARVFYFESRYGGRVFFDELGWPWPKHPCTDNPKSMSCDIVYRQYYNGPLYFKNKNGDILDIYEIKTWSDEYDRLQIKFRRIRGKHAFTGFLDKAYLNDQDINIEDLRCAPSFVIKKNTIGNKNIMIEFICVRKKEIVQIIVQCKHGYE